ncbi:MAG: hypothetical protein ACOH2F_04505 [Cellulomonas sp.]
MVTVARGRPATALSQLVGVLVLANGDTAEGSVDLPGQVMAGLARFTDIGDAGLVVFVST